MKKMNDLGKDPILSLVVNLAVPSMIAQFVNVLYSIIDRIYIGNIPTIGDLALAGVGICGPIVTFLSSFGTLVGLGGSILMAMKMGAGKKEDAKRILANSFLLLIIFSIALTILFLLLKDRLLYWFGASQTIFPYANTYMTIYTAGTFFALMTIGLNSFITCQGFSSIAMITVLIGAVTNIALDPVFIFLFKLGVAGAAYATVIAQMCSFLFAIRFLTGKKVPIKISLGNYSVKTILKIINLGFSPFLILATDSFIIIIMNSMLQHYGGKDMGDLLISAATIVQSYFLIVTGPMLGITSGTQAILSYNYGAAASARVRKTEKYVVISSVCYAILMFVIAKFTAKYFVQLFTSATDLVDMSVWGIKVFTSGILIMALQYSFIDGLTALGRTKTALALSILRKSTYTGCTILLPMLFTAKCAFYAEPVADVVCGIITTSVFLCIFEKHLKKREAGFEI